MDWAKSKKDGVMVRASEATRSQKYLCPQCGAPVTLRRGSIQRDHFAHRKGVGTEACELFHPSDYAGFPTYSAPNPSTVERLETPYLAIQYSLKGQILNWSMVVVLPKPFEARGQLSLRTGVFDSVDVDLSDSLPRRREIRVDLGVQKYRVDWTSADLPPEYAAAVDVTLDAPSSQSITVFNPVTRKLATSIELDSDYFFLFKKGFIDPSSLPLTLTCEKERGGWVGCIASVPNETDAGSAETLANLANIEVAPLDFSVTPLHIGALGSPTFRNFGVKPNDQIAFCIASRKTIDNTDYELEIFDGSETITERYAGCSPRFIRLRSKASDSDNGHVILNRTRGFRFFYETLPERPERQAGLVVCGRFVPIFGKQDNPVLADYLNKEHTYLSVPTGAPTRLMSYTDAGPDCLLKFDTHASDTCTVQPGNSVVELHEVRQIKDAHPSQLVLEMYGFGRLRLAPSSADETHASLSHKDLNAMRHLRQVAIADSANWSPSDRINYLRAVRKEFGTHDARIPGYSSAAYLQQSFKSSTRFKR